VKETLISAALKRIGKRPLKRLEWAVDFSQRVIDTPEEQSKAELELTCFFWAPGLQDDPSRPIPKQIDAVMTDRPWIQYSYRGQEVKWAQQAFAKTLMAAASDRELKLPLRHVTAKFTRAEGLDLVSVFRSGQSPQDQQQSKLEAIAFRLLLLLDKKVVTGTRGPTRLTPVRLYAGLCPKERDGCGKLFAKNRIDQEYCSRTCVSGAQVHRFRRNLRALKQLYPGKRMKGLAASERARVKKHAESLR
jgi:hypothetical protein